MIDTMEKIGNSLVQHGFGNDRVYLMKLHPDDGQRMVAELEWLARTRGYGKIFAKVPACAAEPFRAAGYLMEAAIPGFFPEGDSAYFLVKYLNAERARERRPELVDEVLRAAGAQQTVQSPVPRPAGCVVRLAEEADVVQMSELYRTVFASYPFPIHDPGFLRESMREHTIYFGVWKGDDLVALSSTEYDYASGSAEMTDFATLPECRGQGLALHLLQLMEGAMQSSGIASLFTIARAYSFGMNITFARNGYRFAGTLVNNTNISGSLESMNVWFKQLPRDPEPSKA